MGDIDTRIDKWKSKLLDLGKRNRLINYKDTKRSNIKIIEPNISELFEVLVKEEKNLKFSRPLYEEFLNEEDEQIKIIEGDLKTNSTIKDQQKILRNLRNKSKTAKEEQGVNILYISFGFLKWKESQDSEQILVSPIVLVPVALTLESITSPYVLSLYEDEVVINPTLVYKLENDFGIVLPEFDSHEDNINEYLSNVNSIVSKNNWKVSFEIGLSLLSFLKINMYKDLDKNKERIRLHPIIKALSADLSEIATLSEEYNNYDHDKNTIPIDTFQVVDADSSQQDAILFSKKGISFVLQGPPGTGKSQTITNIIAEALADGKKILFVSEKMAALEVVYKRLKQAGLDDFCLNLHSYKANKKEVLQQLAKTLNINKIKLQKDVLYNLEVLNLEKAKLNEYDEQLHSICRPLNMSIYDVNGKLAKLQDIPEVVFPIKNVKDTSSEKLRNYKYLLEQLSGIIGQMSEDYKTNPWHGCNVSIVTHELRHDIETYLRKLYFQLKNIAADFNSIKEELSINKEASVNGISELISILGIASKSPKIPIEWILEDDVGILIEKAENYKRLFLEYNNLLVQISKQYEKDFCNLPASNIKNSIISRQVALKQILNLTNFNDEEKITRFSHSLCIEVSEMLLKIESTYDICQEICDNLDVKLSFTMKSLGQLHNLLDAIIKNPKPTEMWFNLKNDSIIKQLFSDGKNRCEIISEKTAMILSKYENEILNIDYESMLKRFTVEYTEIYKLINKCYTEESLNLKNDDRVISYRIFNEFYDNVIETLKSLLPVISEAYISGNKLVEVLSLKKIETINSFVDLCNVSKLVLSNPKPTEMWFDIKNDNKIEQVSLETQNAWNVILQNRSALLNKYESGILDIDCELMLKRFTEEYIEIYDLINKFNDVNLCKNTEICITNKNLINFYNNVIEALKNILPIISEAYVSGNKLVELLSLKKIETINSFVDLCNVSKLVLSNPKPTKMWFNSSKTNVILQLISEVKEKYRQIDEGTKIITTKYESEIFNLDYSGMLIRFKTEYTSFLKVFKGNYKEDKNTIRALMVIPDKKIDDLEIIDLLNRLKKIDENKKWLRENEEFIKSMFGNHYSGKYTDWKLLKNDFENFQKICSCFPQDSIPVKLKQVLLSLGEQNSNIEKEYNNANKIIEYNVKFKLSRIFFDSIEVIKVETLQQNIAKVIETANSVKNDFTIIESLKKIKNMNIQGNDIVDTLNEIKIINEKKKLLKDNQELIKSMFGNHYLGQHTDWELLKTDFENFQKICSYFSQNIIPVKLKKVLLLLGRENDSIKKEYNVVNKIIEYDVNSKLHEIFSNSIETIEVETLQQNIIKIIQVSDDLKKDFVTIKSLNKMENTSLEENQNNIVYILNELKNIDVARCWIIENEKSLKTFLGTYYFKEKTNWQDVQRAIDNFMIIRSYFGDNPIPQKIRELLLSSKFEKEYIIKTINSINSITNDDFKIQVNKIFNFDNIETTELGQVIDRFSNSVVFLGSLYKSFDELNQFANKEISYTDTMNNLNKLIKIQEIKKNVELNYKTLEINYDRFFNGIETDWGEVLSILGWTNEFKTLCKKYELSNAFIEKICNCDSSIIYAKDALKKISCRYQEMQNNWNWFINLFDEKEELLNINLLELLTRTENCLNNIAQLEEWIDFRSIRKLCNEEGLSDFVDKIQLMKVHNTLIVPIFFKRFYRLWLDSILSDYPAINNFRRRNQEERINSFKKLDLLQLSIARFRIREKLISKLPDVNDVASSFGEVSVLKHELNKQRKIMPLRKLFMAIPNLLTSLKPCLMMSPLSVSLFLQGDSYNFDIVIFDEASQVCTEDAIGAIIRGKQVVIAGDSKQLPPTNFFSSTTSDSDFDSFEDEDESYEDIDGYESILDEAVTVLPERSLKWHYRSRHEHLIAFSNAKIYNNNLITFPSSIDEMPDNGVEYVYVENGVYDRGGKKNNIIEAKKVAELVFKHIKDNHNRSLGVVTFSESQQQAIETIIRQMRINNQEYENFFNEEKEEAFFVKNLENVQGDERDTIIFSIGYAKDSNGVMYMNFGPLSKNGGYRRLNVAITRAKYNIKLVGSIRPTDINIERTNSKGVKMLRSYIEFAINGTKALEQENTCTNSVEVESPFEEAVYDFLLKKGFLVSTQVGCSGYRIDIAIRHPKLAGRFVLGIECDGATYHSARTARERDRLRQSILEDMGWKIYRIWSTDWIKDPTAEGDKLVEVVNKAILEYDDDDSDYFNKKNEENVQCSIENEFVEIEKEKNKKEIFNEEKNIYGFNWYEEADIYSVNKQGSKSDYLANVIKFVIETEQPIHFEQLCKRVAPLLGNQKATIKVRNSVKNIINLKLKNEAYIKGKFCFLNSDKPINVRIPRSNKNCRQINFISIEELSRAMYVIASKGFGITQNDLFVITARTFGFQRIGDNITQAMKNAFKYLIDTKKVIIINGKVVCDSSYEINKEKKAYR